MTMNIEEAVPKSVKERMFRRIRPNKVTPGETSMKGRVVPKKTADNMPKIYKHKALEEEDELQSIEKFADDLQRNLATMQQQFNNFKATMDENIKNTVENIDKWRRMNEIKQRELIRIQRQQRQATAAETQVKAPSS